MTVHLSFVVCSVFRMRYVAAYLLAVLGGNTSPSAKDIKAILGSVGIEADDERLNKVCLLTTVNNCHISTDIPLNTTEDGCFVTEMYFSVGH